MQIVALRDMSSASTLALLIGLVLEVSQVLPRKSLELDTVLNQERVVVLHQLEILRVERLHYVIADVMDASGTNITTGSFQLMNAKLHFNPVFIVETVSNLAQAACETHDLKPL